jgi:diacylglycerol kinase family enzyme
MAMKNDVDRDWLLLANGSAGSAEQEQIGAVLRVLAGSGCATLVETASPSEAVDAVRASPGLTAVLLGGDGTISSTVDALVQAGYGDRPIGLVPAGTGNDLARALGLSLDPARAAQDLLTPTVRSLSALRLGSGRIGVNACHLGVGAASSRTASSWKSRLGPAAYPAGALVAGARQGPWSMRLTADGETSGHEVLLMMAVALGRTIGGGTELSAEADVDGAAADVIAAPGRSPLDRIRLAKALVRGDARSAPHLNSTRGRSLLVESEQPVPLNLDGEDLGEITRLEIRVEPRVWTLLAPSTRSRP